jgi:hypothetical protein
VVVVVMTGGNTPRTKHHWACSALIMGQVPDAMPELTWKIPQGARRCANFGHTERMSAKDLSSR